MTLYHHFYKSGYMETEEAVLALAALSQSTRLEAFRTLVRHEPDGLAAGDLARLLEVPPNTLSAHLSILTRARLVTSERHSRSIVYRADLADFRDVAVFLLQDCCGGRPEVCDPLVESLKPAARQSERRKPCPTSMYNVLFLCTGNSARSILAEVDPSQGRQRPLSMPSPPAASPKGTVNPFALRLAGELELSRPTACARRAGRSSPRPARRRWISSSPFATTPPAKPARSGRASR